MILAADRRHVAAAAVLAAIDKEMAFAHAIGQISDGLLSCCTDFVGETIAAVARCAGWIAHALEEYRRRSRFRLRAVYTGSPPM